MACRFEYCSYLYLSEDISLKKLDKIKKKLSNKPLFCNAYLILPSACEADQLDIYRANQFAQRIFQGKVLQVLGIAKNYDDALLLVEQMVKDCFKERGDCNLKEYLACKQQ